MDMGCLSRELIYEYIDGELENEKAGYIKEHMKRCDRCRKELESSRMLQKVIESALSDGESLSGIGSLLSGSPLSPAAGMSKRILREISGDKRVLSASGFKFPKLAVGFMLCLIVISALYIGGYGLPFISLLIGSEGIDAEPINNEYVEFLFTAHFEGGNLGRMATHADTVGLLSE